jgi:hypothetical protein
MKEPVFHEEIIETKGCKIAVFRSSGEPFFQICVTEYDNYSTTVLRRNQLLQLKLAIEKAYEELDHEVYKNEHQGLNDL